MRAVKGPLKRWSMGGALLSAIWFAGCPLHANIHASHALGARRPRIVAILPFHQIDPNNGEDMGPTEVSVGRQVMDGCTSGLRLVGVEAVARERVAAAMAEAHVAIYDPTNAASIAKRVGADAAIVGSVEFRKFHVNINVRLIRAENGAVDASAHAEFEDVLARDACKALVSDDAVGVKTADVHR